MHSLSNLTPRFILKIASQVLLMDLLCVLGVLTTLIKCHKLMITSVLPKIMTLSIPQKILFFSVAGYTLLILIGFFVIRLNSICIGKKRGFIDCLYRSLSKSIPTAILILTTILLLPCFSGALIMLLSEVAHTPFMHLYAPTLCDLICQHDMMFFNLVVLSTLIYSFLRFPIFGIIYLPNQINFFESLDKNLKILSGHRLLFCQISALPILLLFILNSFCQFSILLLVTNFFLGAFLLSSWIVFYQQLSLFKS